MEFKRIEAGRYKCRSLKAGYVAQIEKRPSGTWLAELIDGNGKVVFATDESSLKLARAVLRDHCQTVMVTVKNLMSDKDVDIAITTPSCCDPSTETYWSM